MLIKKRYIYGRISTESLHRCIDRFSYKSKHASCNAHEHIRFRPISRFFSLRFGNYNHKCVHGLLFDRSIVFFSRPNIYLFFEVLLVVGVRESSFLNIIFTGANLAVVIFIVIVGTIKSDPTNWQLDVYVNYLDIFLNDVYHYNVYLIKLFCL